MIATGVAAILTGLLAPIACPHIRLAPVADGPRTVTDLLAFQTTQSKRQCRRIIEHPHFSVVRPYVSLPSLGIELDACLVSEITFDFPCYALRGWGRS